MKWLTLVGLSAGLLFAISLALYKTPQLLSIPATTPPLNQASTATSASPIVWSMKLVNEDVTDTDLNQIASLGIGVIEGEWGMAEATPTELVKLLDRLQTRNLKFVMNFADDAAWADGGDTGATAHPPTWQIAPVQTYITAIKNHPALYGYDISNEAGENLSGSQKILTTTAQLEAAAHSVRELDTTHPILMRMHYWDEEDGDFTAKNPFAAGIADIVMLNLYSNYSANGKYSDLPTMLADSGQTLVDKIVARDPSVEVWISLASFRDQPLFIRPSAPDLRRDIAGALQLRRVAGISFFGWGPERYPEVAPGWYLPRDGQDLLEVIRSFTTPTV